MLTTKEYLIGLYGAARLALFQPDGIGAFPPSVSQAIRSFQTLFAFFPLWVALNWPRNIEILHANGISLGIYVFFVCLLYVIALLVQLLVTHAFAVRLGVAHRFTTYVNATNWTSLLSVPILIALNSFGNRFFTPETAAASFFEAFIQALLLAYSWFVITMALQLKPRTGLGIVILQFILFFGIQIVMMNWLYISIQLNRGTP